MNTVSTTNSLALSHGALIEKIEILRSTLRLASSLEGHEANKLLEQCRDLREYAMRVWRSTRLSVPPGGRMLDEALTDEPVQRLRHNGFTFQGVFGENPKLLKALHVVKKGADTQLPVLIEGESGTGKELLAKFIHANSSRSQQPFVSVNCGAIPDSLLEAELFGHKKGAFTGAVKDRKGKFESADKGTLFLDEIGELSPAGQIKLLRVLQSQEIQRVGSDEPLCVNTRIVAATNQKLSELMEKNLFREDLFYRLSVMHVTLPPLRERRDEIPLLCDHFCDEAVEKLQRPAPRLTPRLQAFLLTYHYPGNIRELRNIIWRLCCLADGVADLEHLPDAVMSNAGNHLENRTDVCEGGGLPGIRKAAADLAEKYYIEQRLREVDGSVTALAERVGLNRCYLQTLLKKHGLKSKAFRRPKPAKSGEYDKCGTLAVS